MHVLNGLGVDFASSPGLRLGLDASYDHLYSRDQLGADFGSFAIGTRVTFGRR